MDVTPRFWDALGGPALGDLPRAQALYRRVIEVGGTGTTYVQKALPELTSTADDPASIPFWLEILARLAGGEGMSQAQWSTISQAASQRILLMPRRSPLPFQGSLSL
jgi:hypothetical protein